MKTSLRAILFDFDGVLADTEPVHLRLFQQILKEEGVSLGKSDYYEKYLGLDDRSLIEVIYKERQKQIFPQKQSQLIEKKHHLFLKEVEGGRLLFPGVLETLQETASYYRAVVSGALREEIKVILRGAGILDQFQLIVGADDVSHCKPDPEGFLTTVRLLNRDFVPSAEMLLPKECLVIEDSPWGIEAAKKAGMKCLALTTSYPKERLTKADLIVKDLAEVEWEKVERL